MLYFVCFGSFPSGEAAKADNSKKIKILYIHRLTDEYKGLYASVGRRI
jgi:hypothetical protein